MTNPNLERAARAAAVACEQVRPSDEHDTEAWTFIARAVLMAVLDEADAAGETEYRFIRAILAPEWPVESVTDDLDSFKQRYIKPAILAEGE